VGISFGKRCAQPDASDVFKVNASSRCDPLYEGRFKPMNKWSAEIADWGNIGWIGRANYLQVPSLRN
jgi:hypothetical protein